jgi:hypothetical protein
MLFTFIVGAAGARGSAQSGENKKRWVAWCQVKHDKMLLD